MKIPDSSDKKEKRKQFKRITRENLLRPKTFTLRNYSRFISQFIDKYNWGCINSNNEKSFRYSTDWINSVPHKSYIRLREKYRSSKYYDISLDDHLKARQNSEWFVFYTSNINSDLCFLTGDIDPVEGYGFQDCLQAYYYIEKKFHSDTYFEPSTSGSGVHFYTIIDFSSFPKELKYNRFNRENCNQFIKKYSQLMSDLINSMFYCRFDKFSGTYPLYDSSRKFISRGLLGKLPCIQTDSDFHILINTPVLSYGQLIKNISYMQELLTDTGISSGDCSSVNNSGSVDNVIFYSLSLSSSPGNSFNNQSVQNQSGVQGVQSGGPGCVYLYNILGADLEKQSENDDNMHDNNAFTRTRNSIQKLARELGRIPEYEEWNEYYTVNECNTGEETEERKRRYEATVKYVEKTFDVNKIGPIYRYGEFIEYIKQDITEAEISEIVREKTNYKYRITYGDLDVGVGAHWMAVRTNNKQGKELSVPRDTIPALFKALKEKGIIRRSCNLAKSKAIREVLQQMKYIKLVDDYYSYKKGEHISQKWGMDVKFPKYDDYQLFCSKAEERALKIKQMREKKREEVKAEVVVEANSAAVEISEVDPVTNGAYSELIEAVDSLSQMCGLSGGSQELSQSSAYPEIIVRKPDKVSPDVSKEAPDSPISSTVGSGDEKSMQSE